MRHADAVTSAAAAESIRPVLGTECHRVLEVIRRAGWVGATAHEIRCVLRADGVDRDQNVVARRCSDLRDAGLIVDSGRTRSGRSNRQLIVWSVAR